ncbi:lipase [Streptomyces spiroverticillatus]|uniref:Lipase n=1 Tax=Streptomyces finlayi TaxID=67296 RepID=A0A919CAG9_9ACTN|nr:SGNH/GDSL hydrolase family protein [Streptomyces finlayi]GHA10632.1 lipase [Streptomyces spiroverticillatus]GHC95509.1 lipase [Streptomyces finlayi]
MRSVRRLAVALAALGALGAAALPASADAPQQYKEYVALGDSWSADVTVLGIDSRYAPSGCAQSSWNYPKQVAAALAVPVFRDATCGAATTEHLTAEQDVNVFPLIATGVNTPQFDRLTAGTDLVTLGIGGNDAGLAGAVTGCINLLPHPVGRSCKETWTAEDGSDLMSAQIAAVGPKVKAAVEGIKKRSPKARILLVDYMAGAVPDRGCYPYVQIWNQDLMWFGARLKELNGVLAKAAADTGVELVDTYSGSTGHDVCQASGTKWVEGVLPLSTNPPGLAVPFHPNRLGADHQARTVLTAVRNR